MSLLFLSACRPYHSNALDALTEYPGYLENASAFTKSSVRILQQQDVTGGTVILYRWQTPKSVEKQQYCLAATFVASEGYGWRAQSSGSVGVAPADCIISEAEDFVAAYTVGGNSTPLSIAYGIARGSDTVRVEWSDGVIMSTPVENNSFLLTRPDTIHVRRIELLNVVGEVLESKTWP
ncbi:MAG: hypothetical protein RMK99_00015 [Anaerolineales bacterium]|nr:hypothetical protein [Anaerolineales bacterium]